MYENPYDLKENIELGEPIFFDKSLIPSGLFGDVTTPYCSTFLGHRFYPREPRITKIEIEDIANGLAFSNRFNGQTGEPFSIGQHSLIVSALLPDNLKLEGLLHDGSEAYLGDWVKPIKVMFPEMNKLESAVTDLIVKEFKLDFSDYDLIKRADNISLATEKRDLMPRSTENWAYLDGIPTLKKKLVPMDPHIVKEVFINEYYRLVELRELAEKNKKSIYYKFA